MLARADSRPVAFPTTGTLQIKQRAVDFFEVTIFRKAMGTQRVAALRAFKQQNVHKRRILALHLRLRRNYRLRTIRFGKLLDRCGKAYCVHRRQERVLQYAEKAT